MNFSEDIIILLTAPINPNGTLNTKLQDPEIRKEQYLEAIIYCLNETNLKIVFRKNTNYNLLKKVSNYKRVEFITFSGNNYN